MNKQSKLISTFLIFLLGSSCVSGMGQSSIKAQGLRKVAHENQLVDLQTGDLLKNGNFADNANAWNIVGQNSGIMKDVQLQANCGYLGKTTDAHANGHIWQDVTLKPKTTYVLSAKVKVTSTNPQDSVTLDVKKGGSNVGQYFRENKVMANVADWQNVSLEFTTDDTTNFAVGLGRWFENASDSQKTMTAYLADVKLQEKGSSAANDQYDIVWADDFNGNKLDTTKWDYELGSIRGVEQEHYVKSKENVDVSNGHLKLRITDRAKEDQYKNPRGNRQVIYNSGSIRTHGKQDFLYGRIEIKAKLPKGKAVFPAFWTLGSDFTLDGKINPNQGAPWPVSGEIDIMELIGQEQSQSQGNKTVYQTLHYGPGADQDSGKYAGNGTSYSLTDGSIFNDDYHIFGMNWSKGKIEWYVDNKIVRTVDYSDDPLALKTLDRPQYVQLNLAAGGNWPGDAGTNLAGQEFDVDYIYYAQNEQQKADAAQYYANAAKITGAKDVTMTQGQIPDLLANVSSDKNTQLDFSVDDEYQFKNTGGNTNVNLVCSGKDDAAKLATLPAGKYNLYYTAVDKQDSTLPAVRKTVLLTVEPRSLVTDLTASNLTLSGYQNDTLSTIVLPDGWSWDNPSLLLKTGMQAVKVNYNKNGFKKQEQVGIDVKDSISRDILQAEILNVQKILQQTTKYTTDSLWTLETKLSAAQAVLANQDSTYGQITQVYQALIAAKNNLCEKNITSQTNDINLSNKQQIANKNNSEKLPQTGIKQQFGLSLLGIILLIGGIIGGKAFWKMR